MWICACIIVKIEERRLIKEKKSIKKSLIVCTETRSVNLLQIKEFINGMNKQFG